MDDGCWCSLARVFPSTEGGLGWYFQIARYLLGSSGSIKERKYVNGSQDREHVLGTQWIVAVCLVELV